MCPSIPDYDMHLRTVAATLVLLFLVPTLSGCFGAEESNDAVPEENHWLPPVEERSELTYRDDDDFSRVSENGSYQIGEVMSVYVPVTSISVADGGAGVTGGAEVHMGLWLSLIHI